MDTRKLLKLSFSIVAILSMGLTTHLFADDTEVYLGANQVNKVRPNITFIIDTSGSMKTDVTLTAESFDPARTYTGPCDPDLVYWSSGTTPPNCDSLSKNRGAVTKSKFVCNDAADPLFSTSGSGFYVGRAARYRLRSDKEDYWLRMSDKVVTDEYVECEADWGVHGLTDASKPYPADQYDGGPWRADTTNAITWSSTGRTYTFYSANYLNYLATPGSTVVKTRLEIVQEVFSELMDSISNVNIAVMRYDNDTNSSTNRGGYFVMPMQQLTPTNRQTYKNAVNAFTPGGWTPLSETLYEAYQYYRGGAVKFGNSTAPGTNHPDVLDPADSSFYKSPVEFQCQKNFVILLTDGDPTYDTDADTNIQSLPDFSAVTGSSSCSSNCLDELAKVMYESDCTNTHLGTQNVITYTIGFATDQVLLSNAANNGGGSYYTADNAAMLTNAFTAIITDILAINTTFTAPAVSVNAFNRAFHNEELYYALFRPGARPKWTGNIKRYKLWRGTTAGDPLGIRGVDGQLAVDPNTGFTYPDSTSWWTSEPDGDDVGLGGVAGQLTTSRKAYTYTGTSPDLTDRSNLLHEDNALTTATPTGKISSAMLGGLSGDAELVNLLKWIRGIDVDDDDGDGSTTDARNFIADPLHTQPALVTYGGTVDDPDITLFSATNEGYLHAFNTKDGTEYFAFMPKELLPNISSLYANSSSILHPYGLDGPLTYWHDDKTGDNVVYDENGVLNSKDGVDEFVYLYQGMRRGGKSYFALDVTDRNKPTFIGQITGGSGGTTGFAELAQTWSRMVRGKIKFDGADIDVMVFGGGYDTAQDGNSTAIDDSEGRAIYMVNARTGDKIWEAGPPDSADINSLNLKLSDMTNSIPGEIQLLDANGDGYSDRMYVGDMRGQVWRFDINNAGDFASADSLVTGGVIAKLGGTAEADNRRFYYAPQVALSMDRTHYSIVIGSGYRAHPLNETIHDAVYMLKDPYRDPISSYTYVDTDSDGTGDSVITMSDLEDLTYYPDDTCAIPSGSHGWYIWLNEGDPSDPTTFIGEKVTGRALVFNNTAMFTTYTPVAVASDSCAPSQGRALLYQVRLTDACWMPGRDDPTKDPKEKRRPKDDPPPGLSPPPVLIFPPGECLVVCTGLTCTCSDVKRIPEAIRWNQE